MSDLDKTLTTTPYAFTNPVTNNNNIKLILNGGYKRIIRGAYYYNLGAPE